MSANASIKQAAANAQDDTDDIRYPVVHFGASIKAGLDEFNGTAISAGGDEYRKQPKAARASQREDQCGEGYKVHQLVAALGCRGRRLQGPEHRDGQSERHYNSEENVEVLAHPPGCIWGDAQRQARASVKRVRG